MVADVSRGKLCQTLAENCRCALAKLCRATRREKCNGTSWVLTRPGTDGFRKKSRQQKTTRGCNRWFPKKTETTTKYPRLSKKHVFCTYHIKFNYLLGELLRTRTWGDFNTPTSQPKKQQSSSSPPQITPENFTIPNAQWCWPIYLQNWVVLGVNVGTYASPIEHLGIHVRI